jgi:predicted secreted Zn-dependent protease
LQFEDCGKQLSWHREREREREREGARECERTILLTTMRRNCAIRRARDLGRNIRRRW